MAWTTEEIEGGIYALIEQAGTDRAVFVLKYFDVEETPSTSAGDQRSPVPR